MRLAEATVRKHSSALGLTKSVAKYVTVIVLLLATMTVLYLAT